MSIFCLFTMANDYDQPPNCLVAFWHQKPTTAQLLAILPDCLTHLHGELVISNAMREKPLEEIVADMLENGTKYRFARDDDYWLEEVHEGVKII